MDDSKPIGAVVHTPFPALPSTVYSGIHYPGTLSGDERTTTIWLSKKPVPRHGEHAEMTLHVSNGFRCHAQRLLFLLLSFFWWFTSHGAEAPTRLEDSAIPNLFRVTDSIFSGATPPDTNALVELKRLGVQTIITVDGAKPDADGAAAFGMRYVHLPIGYGELTREQELRLIKAASTLPRPIYIHCHHGKHRGPTAAAILCRAQEGWTHEEALAWMNTAGTGTNYTGLFKSVRELELPTAEILANVSTNFPAEAATTPMVDAMVAIDEHFETLAFLKTIDSKKPPTKGEPEAIHRALLMEEAWRELARSPETQKHPSQFKQLLAESESSATELRKLLEQPARTPVDWDRLRQLHSDLNKRCNQCHRQFRN